MKTTRKITQLAGFAAIMAFPVVLQPAVAAARQDTARPNVAVPTKEFRIYNNSLLGPIYPVISTPEQGIDKWLQAFFGVFKPGLKDRLYANEAVYRIYINPTTGGIPPGGHVTLTVPLYTQLLETKFGKIPDEFINWWNGGRVSIYDVESAIKLNLAEDKKNPTTPIAKSPLVVCTSGCKEPLAIYHGTKIRADLPANDPAQLTEYTLGGINEKTIPIGFKDDEVDYDISYVDQVYLPVAMEAVDNPFIGWIGTSQDVGTFKGAMQTFLDSPRYPGWPTYVDRDKVPFLRIPSSATIYASESGAHPSPDLTTPGESFNAMTKYWKSCIDAPTNGNVACKQIQDVEKLFLANYAAYKLAWIAEGCIGDLPPEPDIEKSMLPHVYGWVPFNETPPFAKCAAPIPNALYDTPGYTQVIKDGVVIEDKYQVVQEDYKLLQYETPGGIFNPYVQLVHYKPFLDMTNAYSFSIDDAVGNMQTVGGGLIITVGGVEGMPNKNRFDTLKKVEVTVGAASPGGPKWLEYGFCANYPHNQPCQASTPYTGPNLSFNLQTVEYPAEVTLLDSNNTEYKFVIQKGGPYGPSPGTHDDITCLNQFEWCSFINAYTDAVSNPKVPVNAVVTRSPINP